MTTELAVPWVAARPSGKQGGVSPARVPARGSGVARAHAGRQPWNQAARRCTAQIDTPPPLGYTAPEYVLFRQTCDPARRSRRTAGHHLPGPI